MTDYLFRDDAYLAEAEATVTAAGPEGIELDRTLFYASSGGQPGDTGRLVVGGGEVAVTGDRASGRRPRAGAAPRRGRRARRRRGEPVELGSTGSGATG